MRTAEIARKSFDSFCDQFYCLIKICLSEAKVKEFGDIYINDISKIIPKVQFCGQDSGVEITIGLSRQFYLITKLEYTNNLKYMPDSFWQQLFKLSDFGNFEFKESSKPPIDLRQKHPLLFNKRGSVYKLMRNYFLNEIEYQFTNSLGCLTVKWNSDAKLEDIFSNICATFKTMYNLNFMLWEAENKQNRK